MKHRWKALDLEITDSEYHYEHTEVKLYHLKPQTLNM